MRTNYVIVVALSACMCQSSLLTLPQREDKDSTCRASCALGILRQGARSRAAATRTNRQKRVRKLRRSCRGVISED